MSRRIGAYLLPGDPTWLATSLSRYYDLLDDLVVLVPSNGLSWTGRPLPVDACLEAVRLVDVQRKARVVEGVWIDVINPLRADTAQRQCGLDHLSQVDWVLQIDNDELLPEPGALVAALEVAEREGLEAVEWPMRVLYRKLKGARFLEVVSDQGSTRFDYPGPIAVRPGARLVEARRTSERFLRPAVREDTASLQVNRDPEPNEVRKVLLTSDDAIVHNSWGSHPDGHLEEDAILGPPIRLAGARLLPACLVALTIDLESSAQLPSHFTRALAAT